MNPGDIYFGRNLFWLRPVPVGCNLCEENYFSVFLENEENQQLSHICSESENFITETIIENNTLTENCKNYGIKENLDSSAGINMT